MYTHIHPEDESKLTAVVCPHDFLPAWAEPRQTAFDSFPVCNVLSNEAFNRDVVTSVPEKFIIEIDLKIKNYCSL